MDVTEQMEFGENVSKMMKLLKEVLSQREREIIGMRYGLFTGKEITQREIGQMLNISRSYVSRIEKRALQKLRDGFDKK